MAQNLATLLLALSALVTSVTGIVVALVGLRRVVEGHLGETEVPRQRQGDGAAFPTPGKAPPKTALVTCTTRVKH